MKILADENIEREIIDALREAGLEVVSVRETYIGIADDEVLRTAGKENAIILTNDKDFGELIFRDNLKSDGVILLRLSGLSLTEKINKTIATISEHNDELENAFTVISENAVRIRKGF